MTTQDLRIGNLVEYNGTIQSIFSLTEKGFVTLKIEEFVKGKYKYEQTPSLHVSDIKPIPITPELLLKFGFSKWNTNEYSISNGRWLYITFKFYKNGNISLLFNGESYKYLKGETPFIGYAHELQNAYYCSTKQELELGEIEEED